MARHILILCLLLAGCTSKPVRISGSGVEAPPPIGYIAWCAEQPSDPMCGAKQ
jgi:starvation-inducible outer membrane lipoprotein